MSAASTATLKAVFSFGVISIQKSSSLCKQILMGITRVTGQAKEKSLEKNFKFQKWKDLIPVPQTTAKWT